MIVWLDLETTGLDPRKHSILEIAMIATDDNLNQIGDPFTAVIRPLHLHGYEVADKYVLDMHTKSGLWAEIYMNDFGISADGKIIEHKVYFKETAQRLGDVERAAIHWLSTIVAPCNCVVDQGEAAAGLHEPACTSLIDWKKLARGIPLGGNTVHFDKRFLIEHMDELEALFSHRIYDVSSFTEEVKRSAPEVYKHRPGLDETGKPVPQHRALDDIRNSIATAKFYRESCIWKQQMSKDELQALAWTR